MKNTLFKKNVIKKSDAEEILGGYPVDTIGERATAYYRLFWGVIQDREPYTDRYESGSQAPDQTQGHSSAGEATS